MSKYSLNADNFLRTLPEVLQDDPRMQALASAIASELETLAQKVQFAEIYTHIDDLDETMLDALAADFKVDWWRPDASVAEKRTALKASWYIHKHHDEILLLAISGKKLNQNGSWLSSSSIIEKSEAGAGAAGAA